jgi:hypothetical protein
MGFADRYIHAVNASSLQDDERHHQAEPLQAAALADRSARHIGALLHRVKYAGTVAQTLAHAIASRERVEKALAEALRTKDEGKQAGCRQALKANAEICAMQGSEVAAFRSLLAAWCEIVARKGADRNWIKPADWPKIGHLAPAMYRRVAEHSLAHYLDDVCKACAGTGIADGKAIVNECRTCCGSRKQPFGSAADLKISAYEVQLAEQMVSELVALEQAHAGVAKAKLRERA